MLGSKFIQNDSCKTHGRYDNLLLGELGRYTAVWLDITNYKWDANKHAVGIHYHLIEKYRYILKDLAFD